MRLHLVGLPHTQFVWPGMTVCAFTSKALKFVEMMAPLGYEIYSYWGEHCEAPVHRHIPVFTDDQQREWYGDHDPNLLPTIATWGVDEPHWVQMNHRAIAEINRRIAPGDLILLLAGLAQKPIADAFPDNRSVEWAAGYDGIFSDYVCFESYAWMSYLYGRYFSNQSGGAGRWYDTVIPNFFRPEDFAETYEREDFLLFVGRITAQKGPHVAAEIAKASGRKLYLAGSGVKDAGPGWLEANEGFRLEGDIEYVGVADVTTRNELMGKAHALIAPTLYIEPFGAVAVEAQLCGTPAITTDWGAFPETVEHGQTGFRFRTLAEAVEAVEGCEWLSSEVIRKRALSIYALDAIAPRYDRWLTNIADLDGDGWYAGTSFAQSRIVIGERPLPDAAQYVVPDGAPHLGGYIAGGDPATQCPEMWRWLIYGHNIQTMLDIGCGEGHALRFFRDHGVEVLGIDGVPQEDENILTWDFSQGPIPLLEGDARDIDLIWCCEFVEHVEQEFEDNYLPLFSRGKLVLMTHATPGQPGHHHVNCQEAIYWVKRLASYGLVYNPKLTTTLRRLCGENGNHFARSGLAFRPVPPA